MRTHNHVKHVNALYQMTNWLEENSYNSIDLLGLCWTERNSQNQMLYFHTSKFTHLNIFGYRIMYLNIVLKSANICFKNRFFRSFNNSLKQIMFIWEREREWSEVKWGIEEKNYRSGIDNRSVNNSSKHSVCIQIWIELLPYSFFLQICFHLPARHFTCTYIHTSDTCVHK